MLSAYIYLIGGYHSYVSFYYENDDGGVDFEIKTVLDNADVDSMQFLTDESYVRIFNTSLQFVLNINETVSINSFKFAKQICQQMNHQLNR